jgi:DNA helicase-2/ATP-dependent DNA helicase PcrA
VEQWIVANPDLYQRLIEGRQFDGEETERLRRQSVLRTEVLARSGPYGHSRSEKFWGYAGGTLSPGHQFGPNLPGDVEDYDVLTMAAGLYEIYQGLLQQQGSDRLRRYDLGALRTLEDPATLRFWQARCFAVFEDEAQDSSPLQTRLLTFTGC